MLNRMRLCTFPYHLIQKICRYRSISKFNDKIIHNITEIPENFNEYLNDKPYHTNFNDIDPNCGMKYIDIPAKQELNGPWRRIYTRVRLLRLYSTCLFKPKRVNLASLFSPKPRNYLHTR